MISVIMPVYNGAAFLRETMDTVLQQTCTDFEFIIVNDGSTDTTAEIIQNYDDERIVFINLARNCGVCTARNMAIDMARGKYIAFCDADDLYDSHRLQVQREFLETHPKVDICGSDFILFEQRQEILIQHPRTDAEIKAHFFFSNCMGQPSIMGKTSVFQQHRYNPELVASEDYDLWARMATAGVVFANVPRALVRYRLHPGQASKTKSRLLSQTSTQVCLRYTLDFLNCDLIRNIEDAKSLTLGDFRKFITELANVCSEKQCDMNTFRPLIAQQYKKLEKLGIVTFSTLVLIARRHQLLFPANYWLNVFLLSILPVRKDSSFFETLTKLKQ
jgi:glycosyltransferase involved in cell wall biosynthesis